MVLFHLFFLLDTTILPRILVLIDLFLLFANNHSMKIYGLHSFIYFIYTRPFDQYIWFPFIYSFFCKRPFDQNTWSFFIYSFFCERPFDQNIWSSFIYSFFSGRSFDQKLGFSLIYFFYLHTTIRLKCIVLFHTFLLCVRSFDRKLESSLIYFFYLCTTIRPKLGFILTLYFFLNCANISYAIYMAI